MIRLIGCPRPLAAIFLTLVATLAGAVSASAQSAALDQVAKPVLSSDGAWMLLAAQPAEIANAQPWVRPLRGQPLAVKMSAIRATLAAAPLEADAAAGANPLILELPDPNGVFQHFAVLESPVMEPGLAALYPDIKTCVGQGIEDPWATLRADVTPQGFHAQVRSPGGDWYIDPYCAGDDAHATSYYKRDLISNSPWSCHEDPHAGPQLGLDPPAATGFSILTSGSSLKTYRIAVACTGEYAAFHGGTVTLAQAAIVTAINRITGVFETEIAVRLTLVANNSAIVYTNSSTDPYTNDNISTMLGENQTNITNVIGSANYDIGHVFSTGDGGVAGIGVVCNSGSKARGSTGLWYPTGDGFWIDYVAHEMGHQLGAHHVFNGVNSYCAGNRTASTAYEPGSGNTIMSYAGTCGADDLQPHDDAYFNWISLQEIRAYVSTGGGSGCGVSANTGNSAPAISAPGIAGLTIPKGTPFALTAVGSDPDGNALTYCWEERNLGPAAALAAPDDGAIPLTRSFSPTTSPTRTVPQLSKILSGTSDTSEKLPSLARSAYAWTVTARDNRAGGGGVERAQVAFAVTAAAGPFVVTSPSSPVSWAAGSTQTVTWNVAGTTGSGVNTATVNILLSTDGGQTFPFTLAFAVPNNGSATFVVPNSQTASGRIKVAPIGNIYFNIAPGTVTITPSASCTAPAITRQPTGVNTCAGGTATFTIGATSVPAPTYQWRKNAAVIAGATSATLVITPVTQADIAAYDCVVTAAGCGTLTSSAANLVIACPNPADVAAAGGAGGCDGQVTVDDLLYFLPAFFAGDLTVADIAGLGTGPGPDGQVTVDDLTAFLGVFFAGCP